MKKLIGIAVCLVAAVSLAEAPKDPCSGMEPDGKAEGEGKTAQSCDPNEISGPLGTGEKRYVEQGDWMDYTIYFENKTNATAAAQEVFVDLPMDENLDWSTLELGEIAFGEHIDTTLVEKKLAGKSKLTASYAMPGTNTSVKTEVKMKDGVLSWYMRDWDPTTADNFPASATGGFLPPNNPETHCGEGHLSFRVRVKPDAPNGAIIRASAQIVFDQNPMIETDPSWWNTVGTFHDITLEIDGVTTNLTLIAGEPFGELPSPKMTRAGYTFDAWYTGLNGTGAKATPTAIVPDGVFSLYANWKANQYIVAFDANGGTGGWSRSLAYGSSVAVPSATRTGYAFVGWYTAKTGGSLVAKSVKVIGNATYYARWKQNATYTVKFFLNDGTKTAKTQTVAVGAKTALAKNAFKRAGWTFKGWALSAKDAAAGKVKYKDGVSVKDLAKQGKTAGLYAVWSLPAWACGSFYGDCECAAAEGVMTVKVAPSGALTGTMTWANGKNKSVVKKFTASAPAYTASYKKKSFAKAFDCAADGDLKLADGSCWTYKKVKVALPKGGSVTGNIIVANCKVVDGKSLRAGDIVFVAKGKLEFDLAQDLWTNADVKSLPNLKKKPSKSLKVKNSGHDQKALYQAKVRKLSFAFADKGVVTVTALDAKGKKLDSCSTHLLVDGVKGGKYFGWTPVYFKKLGRLAWFGVDVKKKSGAAQAGDIALGFDD